MNFHILTAVLLLGIPVIVYGHSTKSQTPSLAMIKVEDYSQDVLSQIEDRHMIVLTLDGTLHCVGQRTGSLLWSRKEDPLIKVSQENLKDFLLVPNPKDGSLYAYDGNQLSKYPFTIPQLVAMSPSRTGGGYLYAGSKSDIWMAISKYCSALEAVVKTIVNLYRYDNW